MRIELKKLEYFIFFLLFIPYVDFFNLNLGSDLQPYTFFVALFILITYRHFTIPREMFVLVLITLEASLIYTYNFLFYDYTLYEVRSLYSYIALFVFSLTSFLLLKNKHIVFRQVVKSIILFYFIIGLIQFGIDRDFLTFLTSNYRNTLDRGISNLMVEPTFYAIFCLLMIYISRELKLNKKYVYILLFQIIILSQSSMIILFLLLYGVIFINKKKFFFIYALSVLIVILVAFFLENRFISILIELLSNPINLLTTDQSINERFTHMYLSLYGWVENYFILPHGFSIWGTYLGEKTSLNPDLFLITEYNNSAGRVMSGYGSILFELGIGGIALIVYVWILQSKLKYSFLERIFFILLMLTAIPLSLPLVGFYIGLLQFNKFQKEKNAINNNNSGF